MTDRVEIPIEFSRTISGEVVDLRVVIMGSGPLGFKLQCARRFTAHDRTGKPIGVGIAWEDVPQVHESMIL